MGEWKIVTCRTRLDLLGIFCRVKGKTRVEESGGKRRAATGILTRVSLGRASYSLGELGAEVLGLLVARRYGLAYGTLARLLRGRYAKQRDARYWLTEKLYELVGLGLVSRTSRPEGYRASPAGREVYRRFLEALSVR